ncbi:hypothetical protein, partial [Plasmodium yoelii yoelii]
MEHRLRIDKMTLSIKYYYPSNIFNM